MRAAHGWPPAGAFPRRPPSPYLMANTALRA